MKHRVHLAVCLLAASLSTAAQTTLPPVDRNVVVLDPAHGGTDKGTTLNGAFEKDLTLTLVANLRASLVSRGFTVITTRDTDLPLTADQRASAANHLRPAACIVVHATPLGNGIHLATSSLPLPEAAYDPAAAVPWETAQSNYIRQSLHLANALGLAMIQAKLPILLTRAALRPLDNLTCPAIALEVSPLQPAGGRVTAVADAAYQRRLSEVVAAALLVWRNRNLSTSPTAGAQ